MSNGIQHVFVLMLENRSFDHMLGFSGISGTDPVTGTPTPIRGLTFSGASLRELARNCEQNLVSGIVLTPEETGRPHLYFPPLPAVTEFVEFGRGTDFTVAQGADFAMPVDPCHEFPCVVTQLCGPGAAYKFGDDYPPVVNSGFVASYSDSGGQNNPGEVIKCTGRTNYPYSTRWPRNSSFATTGMRRCLAPPGLTASSCMQHLPEGLTTAPPRLTSLCGTR